MAGISRRSRSLALAYGTFELGRASAGYFVVSSMLERLDLRKRNQVLADENDLLRHRVAVAEVDQRVDRQAQTDAQQMMGELQAETARQKQELQFYRGLVVRQYGSGTLRVQELSVRAEEEERRYRVLITLVQAATRDTVANGTVTFAVEGRQGNGNRDAAARGDRDRQAQAVPVLAALLPADRGADRAAAGFRARAPPCGVPARAQSRAVEADVRLARGRRGRGGALTLRGPDPTIRQPDRPGTGKKS